MSDMNDYYRLNIPDGEVKRILDSDNKVLWRRAIEKSTNEDNFEGTRNTVLKALSRFGNCTQASTPTPDAPVDIVCNNGALRYGAVGKNLYNVATDVNGYAIDASGNVTAASMTCYSALIPVTAGEYAYSGICSTQGGSNNKRVHGYTNGVWVQQIAMYIVPAGAAFSYVFSVPSGIDAVRISHWSEDAQTQVERGSTATAYEPFVGGIVADGTPEVLTVSASGAETQTVTDIPMLLSIGDITDEKDIISGAIMHRIGYHVFDGTETFAKSTAYGQAFLINAASAVWGADRTKAALCTHFLGLPQKSSNQDDNTCFFNPTGHFYFRVTDNSDIDAWGAFLAKQYAAGTPVIAFFVLATETTESATAQALTQSIGTNIVSTSTEVNGGYNIIYYGE